MRLFDIAVEFRRLAESIDQETGELSPDALAAIAALETDAAAKVRAYIALIKESRAEGDAIAEEAKRLSAQARTQHNLADKYTEGLMLALQVMQLDKFETPVGKCWLQKNPLSAVPLSDDPMDVPERYRKVKIEVSRSAALADWKATGEQPEGFKIQQTQSIRIK